jgi:lipopolysaccharide transport system ATP-binding protein
MGNVAIRAHELSKQYVIGSRQGQKRGFNGRDADSHQQENDAIWALRDVSFEVKQGEVLGVIGRNGSGKSTLLKILSRITKPTKGEADIHGRVGSLLEVGTGFHPELTGRENIRLNGALLGLRKVEIDRHFDAIVAFAEVERFIDTPVKRYSSGMYMRLAFAVAAHLECEILLVDEVLAVGDFLFQQKCLSKMNEVSRTGRTVLFVSHNIASILNLCTKAILLDRGHLRISSDPQSVVDEYLNGSMSTEGQTGFADRSADTERDFVFLAVRILDESGHPTTQVDLNKGCTVDVDYAVRHPIAGLQVGFELWTIPGICVLCTTDLDSEPVRRSAVSSTGRYRASCRLHSAVLRPGRYWIDLGASVPGMHALDEVQTAITFEVVDTGSVEYKLTQGRRGAIAPILKWESTILAGQLP